MINRLDDYTSVPYGHFSIERLSEMIDIKIY